MPSRHRALLILRAKIVIVERVIAAGTPSTRAFEGRRKPHRRKAGLAKRVRLSGQVVPPERNGRIAIQRRWYGVGTLVSKIQCLEQNSHTALSYSNHSRSRIASRISFLLRT